MPFPILKAPFPWFGGKSRVARQVWDRFGDVDNYVEPFAGSLAVLLGRPTAPQTETVNDVDAFLANFWRAIAADPEATASWCDWPVNEADLHARHLWLVNRDEFREKMKTDPDFYDAKIAGWWVWGISQWIGSGWCSRPEWTGRTNAGAHARGIFRGGHNVPNLGSDGFQRPDMDSRGVHRTWRPARQMPHLGGGHGGQGRGITTATVSGPQHKRPMIHGGHTGKGVHAENPGESPQFGSKPRQAPPLAEDGSARVWHKRPDLHSPAKGVQAHNNPADWNVRPNGHPMGVHGKRPHLSGRGTGIGIHGDEATAGLYRYFEALAARLRRVRVCCGDWTRVLGPSVTVKHGVCGIFLDPPYDLRVVSGPQSGRDAPTDALYAEHDNDLSREVREWALRNGNNPDLRIALCGYEGEHDFPADWECLHWKSHGGYGNQGGENRNAARERIWFSPHCLRLQESLFAGL